jgi:transcriptional regulator with XRE-family HTH domain
MELGHAEWKSILKMAGISHEEVAERAGVTRGYVTLVLGGRQRITERISDAARQLMFERSAALMKQAREIAEWAQLVA